MNYGLDYDGVIADMSSARAKWVLGNLGIEMEPWKTDRTNLRPIIGPEKYDQMVEDVFDRAGTLEADLLPGAVEAIVKMSERGSVYIVTQRPFERILYAEERLSRAGVLDKVGGVYSSAKIEEGGLGKSKIQICLELSIGVLVEDDLRHLTEEHPEIRKILLKNRCDGCLEVPGHVEFASSWDEIIGLLGL